MNEASNSPTVAQSEKLENNSEMPEKNAQGELWCSRCNKYGGHKTEDHGQNGGARAGAGRKPGGQNEDTQRRLAIKQAVIDRIQGVADRLLDAQLTKALGESYLMRKVEEKDSKGKVIKTYHEVVTDPDVIIEYLDTGSVGSIDSDPDNWYYMTTKAPDNLALKDLLDRGFGKPDSKLDVTSGGEKLQRGSSIEEIEAILERAEREQAERMTS